MLYAGLALLATLGAPVDQRLARLQEAVQNVQVSHAMLELGMPMRMQDPQNPSHHVDADDMHMFLL